ncbi:MAG: hypothetical protein HY429_02380 [Candidatus Levybacteria bacterium]|nr:hypothetical protein [Candidatus Levybacteria bacterium]
MEVKQQIKTAITNALKELEATSKLPNLTTKIDSGQARLAGRSGQNDRECETRI